MTPIPHTPHTFPASFTPEKQQEVFEEIVLIYDLTDNILSAIQRESNPHRDEELLLATPFITQATNCANVITAFYTEITKKERPVTPEIKDALECAFRNYYIALRELIDNMYNKFMPKDYI